VLMALAAIGIQFWPSRTQPIQQDSNKAAEMAVTVVHPQKALIAIPVLPGQTEAYTDAQVAAALVTLKPGGLRELHWHPNSSEWQFWIVGKGRMTVFLPVDNARTVDFNPNDVGYVPLQRRSLYREYRGHRRGILEMLASDVFEDVSLNQWLRRLPAQMVQALLGFDKASLAKIPDEKLVVV